MRAVFYEEFGTADVLKLGERPRPEPAEDEVLVQVGAAGVNPIDRRLRAGELKDFFQREFPIIPGWDVAGRIVELGSAVRGWATGDEVMGLAFTWFLHSGSYAEYVPVKAESIALKPRRLSFTEAASLPLVSLTSWQSLTEFADLQPGQTVLIQAGAGGMGSVAIPMAKHLGAKVFSTCSTRNVDYVSDLGADHVIDYTRANYAAELREREPQGLDVIMETLAGDEIVRDAILLAKPGGAVHYMNNEPPDMPEIAERGIRSEFMHHRADGKMLGELAALFDQGTIPLPPVEVLDLAEAAEAHRRSESGRTRGKLVLAVQEQ
jgi:NADPH2:quinone reductase